MTTQSIILPEQDLRLDIRVRQAPNARKISMRIDAKAVTETVIVTMPPSVSIEQAMAFVRRHGDWIAQRLRALPPYRFFHPEAEISLLGHPYILLHSPQKRGGAWKEDGVIHVSGDRRYFARRVTDFLKAEAVRHIVPLVHDKARLLAAKPGRISVKDTRSRWGSCCPKGDLAFSWRLILAPDWVLDYVVAHEVAHLREMNHSERFWDLVTTLTSHSDRAHHWLKHHGVSLHRYG